MNKTQRFDAHSETCTCAECRRKRAKQPRKYVWPEKGAKFGYSKFSQDTATARKQADTRYANQGQPPILRYHTPRGSMPLILVSLGGLVAVIIEIVLMPLFHASLELFATFFFITVGLYIAFLWWYLSR